MNEPTATDFAILCNAVAGLCDAIARLERASDGAVNRHIVAEARQKREAAERSLMRLAERRSCSVAALEKRSGQ